MSNTASGALFVFLRFPHPGKAKTRLAQSLGEEGAAQFYSICADITLNEISRLPEEIEKYVFCADKEDKTKVSRWAGPGFHIAVQEGKDLGQRLKNAFNSVLSNGTKKAVAVASDVPDLSAEIMNESMQALDESDIVIGPCYDGGYYLLGMKRLQSDLFDDISWSTKQVLRQTLAAIRKNDLTVHQLQTLIDIDTVADIYKWLQTDKHKQPALDEFFKDIDLGSVNEEPSK